MRFFEDVVTTESAWAALDVLLKLGFGVLLAGAVGWERETHGRPAGIRTHMLVVLGVILFSEVSKGFGAPDPSRIAAQIVTGIGFLGAGTILRHGLEIQGLTTAASIWACAGIGMAVSAGGYFLIVAAAATLLALFTLSVVDNFERRIAPDAHRRVVKVELASAEGLNDAFDAIKRGGKLEALRVVSSEPFVVELTVAGDRERILSALASAPSVRNASWTDPGL